MSDKTEIEVSESSTAPKVKDEPLSDDDVICDSPFVKRDSNIKVKVESGEESTSKMKLTVKLSSQKFSIEIKTDATIKELKEELLKVHKVPIEHLCVIYSGKILNDDEVLSSNNIEDGHTVHMVVRTNTRIKVSRTQKEKMVQYMENNPDLNKGVFSSKFTVRDKMAKWQELTQILNTEGNCIKTMDKWQKCWSDFKVDVKKRYSKRKKYVEGTSGGPAPRDMNELDLRMLSIIGNDTSEELEAEEILPHIISSTSEERHIILEEQTNLSIDENIFNCMIENTDVPDERSEQVQIAALTYTPVTYAPVSSATFTPVTYTPVSSAGGSKNMKRKRTRGMVIPPEKTQSLINAQEKTSEALNQIALQLKEANDIARERNAIELRKAIAFENLAAIKKK